MNYEVIMIDGQWERWYRVDYNNKIAHIQVYTWCQENNVRGYYVFTDKVYIRDKIDATAFRLIFGI